MIFFMFACFGPPGFRQMHIAGWELGAMSFEPLVIKSPCLE